MCLNVNGSECANDSATAKTSALDWQQEITIEPMGITRSIVSDKSCFTFGLPMMLHLTTDAKLNDIAD